MFFTNIQNVPYSLRDPQLDINGILQLSQLRFPTLPQLDAVVTPRIEVISYKRTVFESPMDLVQEVFTHFSHDLFTLGMLLAFVYSEFDSNIDQNHLMTMFFGGTIVSKIFNDFLSESSKRRVFTWLNLDELVVVLPLFIFTLIAAYSPNLNSKLDFTATAENQREIRLIDLLAGIIIKMASL